MKNILPIFPQVSVGLFLFLCFFDLPLHAQTLHLIEVIQNAAPGSKKDRQQIDAEISQIGRATGMRVRKYVYDRSDSGIARDLKNLTVSSNDVIWFYYSGHGQNSGNGYPQFVNASGAFKMTRIHKLLKSKSPRFCLTVFDCCNVGVSNVRRRMRGNVHSIVQNNSTENYRLLFGKSTGDLMVASSKDNRYSFGSAEAGGFFSSSFFHSMRNASLHNATASETAWKKILKKTRTETNSLCRTYGKTEQYPIYDGHIGTIVHTADARSNGTTDLFTELFAEADKFIQTFLTHINSEIH